jgi:hypothetical protein
MKKQLAYILCLLITQATLRAQCPTRPITLTQQQDVDNFKRFFPNCTVIGSQGLTLTTNNILNVDSA